MTLEEIEALWEQDSKLDSEELGNEALRIPQLHSKYWKLLARENLWQQKLQTDYDVLRLDKYEFYTMGPSEEQVKMGWVLPSRGSVIKSEAEKYLQADQDLIALSLKIGVQREKVRLLESILTNINNRSFFIKNKIEFEKFRNGII